MQKIGENPFIAGSNPMQLGCLSRFISVHAVKRVSSNFGA